MLETEDIDVLCITETWLHTNTTNTHFQIENYNLFRKDCSQRGGGTCIYVRDEYNTESLFSQDNHESIEDVWLKVQVGKLKSIIIGAVYRHPKGEASSFEFIEKMLQKASNQDKGMYVLGDFNDNLLSQNKMENIIKRLRLDQLVNKPTRTTDKSATLIDLIITNDKLSIINSKIEPSTFADHHDISCTINLKKQRKQLPTISTRILKNYSPTKFQVELLKHENKLHSIYQTDDVTIQCEIFTNIFNESLDACAPLETRKLTRPPASWMTEEIRAEIVLKHTLQNRYKNNPNSVNRNLFLIQKRKVHNITFRAQRNNNYNKLSDARIKNNPKQTWNILNNILPYKPTKKSLNLENPQTTANKFCKDFATTGQRVHDSVINDQKTNINNKDNADIIVEHETTHQDPTARTEHTSQTSKSKWSPQPITHDENLKRTIYSLKNTKSTGDDGIALQYVKDSLFITLPYIRTIINTSIVTKKFPDQWKHALVVPIHKSGDKSETSNFRPISLLPVLSKILGKAIAIQLMSYMEDNKLMHKKQYAYQSKTSTEDALLNVTEKLYKNIDDKKLSLLVLLDLSKAFDSVNHKLLITKLNKMNVDTEWFESYLSNRTQSVKINNEIKSDQMEVNFGVPQGSILGPILFLVFMNDISCGDDFMNCMTIYADDVQLLFEDKPENINQIKMNAEQALKNIKNWYGQNGLKVNADKTQCIFIGSKYSRKDIPNEFYIDFDNEKVYPKNIVKSLGVWFDNNLDFDYHVDKLCRSLNGTLRYIHSRKQLLDEKSRHLIIQALIFSKINYCQTVWGKCSKSQRDRVQKCVNFAAKTVCNGNYRKKDHVTPLIERLKWLNIDNRLTLKEIIHVFKHVNKLPSKLSFNITNENTTRTRRDPTRLPSTFRRTSKGQLAVSISAIMKWNELPYDLKIAKSLGIFKNKSKTHLLHCQTQHE